MFEYFSSDAVAVVMQAQREARQLGQNFVGTEQLLLGLMGNRKTKAAQILKQSGIALNEARTEVERLVGQAQPSRLADIPLTPKTKRVLEQALNESRRLKSGAVAPEHILLTLARTKDSVAVKVMENLGVDPDAVEETVLGLLEEAVPAGVSPDAGPNPQRRSSGSALEEFGIDLTQRAAEGLIDPVIGRPLEIERVVQILGRRSKNNPVLIGEPGVGKTAIAEGLAQRIVNQDVPEALSDRRVIALEMGRLVGGTRFRGEFEERLKQIVSEVQQAGNVILVIDEVHTLVGTGGMEGGTDAANLLKPALARGELQCIGATTLDEYRQHIETDAALERRFQPVKVAPPSVEDTVDILKGIRSRYEQHHRLTITDEAVEAAATLADRYITDRHLPDKAIDLIDEAGSRVKLRSSSPSASREKRRELRELQKQKDRAIAAQKFKQASELHQKEAALTSQLQADASDTAIAAAVTAEDIAEIVAAWTGVPVNRLTESESAMLMHLEATLHERVIGQEEAVSAVSRAVRRSRVNLKNPDRPIASLLFTGPTGVGKTELTKALAASVFGSEEAMIRLDMSEYMERHTVSKLIGSPPGFVGYDEGGYLTEAVRTKPYSVVLFDEIEKAHPDVFNLLLQVLEDGRLTDAKGRTVSFKNTLLVMTSNLGSRAIERGGRGFGFELAEASVSQAQYDRMRDQVQDQMKQQFRPEFINRIDEVIVFRQLNRGEVEQIADILLQDVNARLSQQQLSIEVTDSFKQRLIDEGYDPSYGARPLRRAITSLVEDALADALLRGTIAAGDTALLDLGAQGEVVVRSQPVSDLVGAIAS
ncbi:MAG: ATP-dependent Clp protease ATP-binding subunit [Cyanobacteria bacterium P01_A01_bin.135]